MKRHPLSRRTFLRGSGIALAIPAMEAMLPTTKAYAATAPLRFITVFFGNGTLLRGGAAIGTPFNKWECTGTGTNFTLSEAMTPLAAHKNDITVIHGLRNDALQWCRDDQDSKDIDHQHGPTGFLTGIPWDKSKKLGEWTLFEEGRSIDQEIGAMNNLAIRVLNLGVQPEGSNLPTRTHISWESQTKMVPRLDTSKKVFDKLFANFNPNPGVVNADYRGSILDFVRDDATALKAKLGAADKAKLEEYFTAVEEIERRIIAEGNASQCTKPEAAGFSENNPDNVSMMELRSKNMIDLMVLGVQCDMTRVVTFMLDNEENNTLLVDHGISTPNDTGHHTQSHYDRLENQDPGGSSKNQKPINHLKYNQWQTGKLATLLQKLKDTKEADGTPLLDHLLLLYGSPLSDSDEHRRANVPIILAGKANGKMTNGRVIRYTGGDNTGPTRESLLLTILKKFGSTVAKVGRATGILPEV